MLPRGVELVKILNAKQSILSLRTISHFRRQLLPDYRDNGAIVSSNSSKGVFFAQRLYTSKDKVNCIYIYRTPHKSMIINVYLRVRCTS